MTALDDYGPFDAGTGANRTEDFWRDFFRHLTGSGVIDGIGSEFAVSERGAGANMSVDVASGECFIRGHWAESTATKNMPISAAHATLARIDRVILRADFTANTMSIEVLEGTPDASPAAPTLTQSSSRWEISLAQISVPATDTSIGSGQITDERTIMGFPTFDQSTAPADGDTWTYNGTSGLWEPAAGGSGTPFVGVRVYQSAGQTVATATNTVIDFGAESFDSDGFHDNASNSSRLTVPTGKAGKYLVLATISLNQTTGDLQIDLLKNGSRVSSPLLGKPAGSGARAQAAVIVDAAVGDYFQVRINHTHGSDRTTDSGADFTSFSCHFLGS